MTQQIKKDIIIALPNAEEAARVHYLGAPRGANDHPVLFSPKLVGGAEQRRDAGVHEHRGLARGFYRLDARVRQHHMQETAHAGHRIVDRDADARAERVGAEHNTLVVGDRQVGDTNDDPLLKPEQRW